jgi:hypothetical protein
MAALVLPEYYADLAQTTLNGAYTSASGTMVVTSAAALSTTRQFHFMITDQTTGAVKCIGKATAVTSNTFTVTMTTDANANSGDFVTITLCAAAEDQIRLDCSGYGTYANLPTVAKNGDYYKCSDSIYEFLYVSGAWQAYAHGYPVTVPPGGWTAANLAGTGSTSNYTNGSGYMVFTGNGGLGVNYVASPGSTPYSFIAKFRVDGSGVLSRIAGGAGLSVAAIAGWALGWRDSSGKFLSLLVNNGSSTLTVYIAHHSSFTDSGTGVGNTGASPSLTLPFYQNLWLKIQNDGTNLKFYASLDRQNWTQLYTETITNYLSAATDVFWGVYQNGTVLLDDWTQGV